MKLFRKFRLEAITQKKIRSYFKYSIGEILIVVIGVMIAVYLNNWNQAHQTNLDIETYFERIQEEITTNGEFIKGNSLITKDSMIPSLVIARSIIVNGQADSLESLSKKIRFLTESESLSFQFPVIEEFVSKGYLSEINDPKLNKLITFFNYYKAQCNITDETTRDYQIHLVKPFLLKNTRYADLDIYLDQPILGEESYLSLAQLLKNREAENLISLYISHLTNSSANFDSLFDILTQIHKRIDEIK